MKRLIKGIDWINESIGKAVSWLNVILIILVCFDVLRRYLLKDSAAWIMELEWHLFALIFLLCAGYTLKHDKHVRVDLFYEKMSAREKAMINFIGALIFLIPWCIVLIYSSAHYAYSSFLMNESSPDPGGLPARFIIKGAITIGFILLALQGFALLLRNFSLLRERETQQNES